MGLFDFLCCCEIPEMPPIDKGDFGEYIVRKRSRAGFLEYQREIHNYTFRDARGVSCQIDHIIIRTNGIFVVETKNYSGKIYGRENQQQWTQVLRHGAEKHKFYNPIKQNASHIFKLKEFLGKDVPIFSIIVFINGDIEDVEAKCVYDIEGYRERVFEDDEYYLDCDEIQEYYELLLSKFEDVSPKEHVEDIENMQFEMKKDICPRCGGKLIEKNGKYGKFKGCSSYPNCKFTMKM